MNDPINESMEKAGTNIFNLEILSEISRIAQSPLNLKERLNTIVNRTAERLGADCCYISLLDKDDKHPNVAEIYIVEDNDRNGIVDNFEK